VHGPQHAGDELVDAVALLDKRDEGGDAALVVPDVSEVGEDELLELLNLVLQGHEVGDGLVPFVGVVDGLEADVLLVLEGAVELGVGMVEGELGEDEVDVFVDQGTVAADALAGHAALQAVDPVAVGHCLPERHDVPFLQNLVDGD
jgi:hypothetical protein